MRKIICCFSLILIQGLFFCTCFAEEGLKVFTPKQKAELATQFIDENKLLVSALDAEGNPIRGLGVEDFVIEREKRTAKILSVEPFETTKEIGLNLVLVVDNSFSMSLREASSR